MSEKVDATVELADAKSEITADMIAEFQAKRITTGSRVTLNSGSPTLTVETLTPSGRLVAGWFTDNGDYRQVSAPVACFTLAK